MKNLIASSLLVLLSMSANATVITSTQEAIAPSHIDKVIRLVDKSDVGTAVKKLSVIVEGNGLSTDVSPRYVVYLAYSSLAEMGNIFADFKITDQAYKFISATRKSAGIYEVKVIEYDGEMFEATYTLDATKIFSDEVTHRRQCAENCDDHLRTRISVTKTIRNLK